MRMKLAALSLVLTLLLCSCSYTGRSYTSVTAHVDQRVSEDDPSVLRAENYQELVSAILLFVSEGAESGTVRLYQYTGDVESDLEAACEEASESDALGAYALYSIHHEYTRIVSYYECTLSFTYRRTADEIEKVSSAASLLSFREQLQQTMSSFGSSFAVRTSLSISEEEILEMVRQYYDASPELALGLPEISCFVYPENPTGQCIREVRFYYGRSAASCRTQQQEMLDQADLLVENLEADAEDLRLACQRMIDGRSIVAEQSDSAYSYLVEGTGSEEAAAMSVLLLCDRLGLEAHLVRGYDENKNDHIWTIVQVGGVWSHLDPQMIREDEVPLLSDTAMQRYYQWDSTGMPSCEGLTPDEAFLPVETEAMPEETPAPESEEAILEENTGNIEDEASSADQAATPETMPAESGGPPEASSVE